MNWNNILAFARGPLFQAALLFFLAGMAYRLLRIIFLKWERIGLSMFVKNDCLIAKTLTLIQSASIPAFK